MRNATLLVALGAALSLECPARAATLTTGLLNYWNFDGTLNDMAHGYAGTASTVSDTGIFDGSNGTGGINYGTGLFGSALDQDGAGGAAQDNGFVRIARSADTLRGGQSLSISLWVRTEAFDTSWQTIMAHGEGNQYRIARRGGDSVVSYAGGSGDIPTSAIGPDIGAGTGWHHIVAISENAVSTRLWVDGSLVETGAAPTITDFGNNGAPGGSTPDLYIGANPQTGSNNREWWGQIDDVAMWDRPLAEEEVLSIYSWGGAGLALGDAILIPEPRNVAMTALGLLGFCMAARRRPRRRC